MSTGTDSCLPPEVAQTQQEEKSMGTWQKVYETGKDALKQSLKVGVVGGIGYAGYRGVKALATRKPAEKATATTENLYGGVTGVISLF